MEALLTHAVLKAKQRELRGGLPIQPLELTRPCGALHSRVNSGERFAADHMGDGPSLGPYVGDRRRGGCGGTGLKAARWGRERWPVSFAAGSTPPANGSSEASR